MTREEIMEKRAERQRKSRKRRLRAFFAVFLVLLLAIGITLSLTVLFPIQKLAAGGSKIYTEEQLLSACGVKQGDNLFTVKCGEVLVKLKKALPYVEDVSLERKIPDEMTIKVRDAGAYACYLSGGKYYITSKSGWVLEEKTEPPQKLFTVTAKNVKCKVGAAMEFKDPEQLTYVNTLIDSLDRSEIAVTSIDVTEKTDLKAVVDGRFTVDFGSSNHIEEKVLHLAGMIQSIGKEKSGKINLSSWTPQNSKGFFVEKTSS